MIGFAIWMHSGLMGSQRLANLCHIYMLDLADDNFSFSPVQCFHVSCCLKYYIDAPNIRPVCSDYCTCLFFCQRKKVDTEYVSTLSIYIESKVIISTYKYLLVVTHSVNACFSECRSSGYVKVTNLLPFLFVLYCSKSLFSWYYYCRLLSNFI